MQQVASWKKQSTVRRNGEGMRNILTFIVPVRHQDNAPSWQNVKRHLSDTILSISQQQGEGWKAIIVANHGADLPDIPPGFEVTRVDFPPNKLYTQGNAEQ